MQYGYIVKISNKNLYKEVQLPIDAEILKIGMNIDCDVRFYREYFFEDFELVFRKTNGEWNISCSDNLYVDAGDVRKLVTKKLTHGDSFVIKYQNSESELFKIDFLFDFDNENKNYDRIIDVSSVNTLTVGSSSNCNIVLKSQYVQNDLIELKKNKYDLVLNIKSTTYGVYHNGKLSKNGEIIKNCDFFSIANFSFYYKNGVIRTSKDVTVNSLNFRDDSNKNDYPKFNRNTRIKIVVDDEKIEILDPPSKPQKPKNNIISKLLPSAVMIVAGLAMVAVSPFMLISSGVGVVTAIISIIQSKKDFKSNSAERIEKYNNYIDKKKQEIEKCRAAEQKVLEEIYIDQNIEKKEFADFSSDLFDRTINDEDFLIVRLGTGNKEAIKEISFKKQERLEVEDDLQEMPEKIYKEYKLLHNAPITCDFKAINAVGIIGDISNRFEIMKNIVIDICARQYYSDLKLFFVAQRENRNKVSWLRMLPHVYNEIIGIRNIVCDDESKNILFEYLYKELTIREENKNFENRFIVFLYDEYGFKNHPISKFVDKAKDLGVTFVFFGETKADITLGCGYLIDIKDNQSATLIDVTDRSKS
jgi:S-DNA-T family DNA segregation ATPase FtsK/SpoIIIE